MTIYEVLSDFDSRFANDVSEKVKIRWLSEFDEEVFQTLMKTHEDCPEDFKPYDSLSKKTKLLIGGSFSKLYTLKLLCELYSERGEIDLYNNAAERFNQEYYDFRSAYNREHLPKGSKIKVV